MAFELPKLDYAYNALEPNIDAQTMEIHHSKHHAAYTTNLNNALNGTPLANSSIEDILKEISKQPVAVRNNGGGFYNHNLFWKVMSPNGGGLPKGDLADAINKYFGSFDKFKEQLSNAAATRFGSGWAWLLVKENSELAVSSSPNQDNPLMDIADVKGKPILGLDVWEHAYYLKYQNKRAAYAKAFWSVVNWTEVEKLLENEN
jgi:superoxide dismutase, Fe-Mn family